MMKTLSMAFVALCVSMAASASAADRPASINKTTLGKMGLGGMQVMSDAEGRSVRGKGSFAVVSGTGFSHIGLNGETTNYSAGASHLIGGSSAIGGNVTSVNVTGHFGPLSASLTVSTAGGSFAAAH
jgi:hypothetical protein